MVLLWQPKQNNISPSKWTWYLVPPNQFSSIKGAKQRKMNKQKNPVCFCEEQRRERGPKGSREVGEVGCRRHFM